MTPEWLNPLWVIDKLQDFFASRIKEKDKATSLYNKAIEDIKYNGPYIGNPKVPFKCDALSDLLSYSGLYSLDEIDKKGLREYIHLAARCNGGSLSLKNGVSPGAVQGRQGKWIQILEKYKSKIELGRKMTWRYSLKCAIGLILVIVFMLKYSVIFRLLTSFYIRILH